MKFRFPTITLLIILTVKLVQGQQDPQFTQFYSNPLYQSPSFAGAVEGARVSVNYRDQWPKMPGKLTTACLAADYNVSSLNSGLGVIVMSDMVGSANYTNLTAGLLYAYNIKINRKTFFRPGLGFYYSQRSLDFEKLILSSQLETSGPSPILGSEVRNVQTFDGTISGLFISRNMWVGLTGDHLMMPNVSFTDVINKQPIKYTLFGGYRLYKIERLISTQRQSITFSGTFRHQGHADQLDLGLYWSYDPIMLGVWYRDLPLVKDYSRRDAIAILLGYKYEGLSIGYSYDFTVSRLITNTGGAHEIALVYKFGVEMRKKFKPIPCPDL
ncbi:MAG: type IX secretion system membrane protein PorP/SprF [Salinivirgaceae bacterium]|jgi:type IX secretion system PorP/SprF family membrane protein|nr:type IX secretion system membrane protein PorP/SprF [Salinivirgaceae bacterium]